MEEEKEERIRESEAKSLGKMSLFLGVISLLLFGSSAKGGLSGDAKAFFTNLFCAIAVLVCALWMRLQARKAGHERNH